MRCKIFEDTGELSCMFQTEEKWGGLGLLQVGISLKFQEIKVIEIETPSSGCGFFFHSPLKSWKLSEKIYILSIYIFALQVLL